MSRSTQYRILVLPVAGVLITVLAAWRLGREADRDDRGAQPPPARRQLAPVFELYDQNNQLVKFERYVGRTRLVVVFFDAARGADGDSWLPRLRTQAGQIESAGVQVVGVSTAVPAENRRAADRLGGGFPFPVLTDIDPASQSTGAVHRLWGLVDAETGETRTGLFLVDRAGMVAMEGGAPIAEADPERVVDALCRGEWPLAER